MSSAAATSGRRVVVVWSEGTAPKDVYPADVNGAIADGLTADLPDWEVVKAGIDDPEQGLPADLLARADVLIWWGHQRHGQVHDALVARIDQRVRGEGMGFISLHSSHYAKPNKVLMGTPCSWGAYVGDSTTLRVTVAAPEHPIAEGVRDFTIVHHERYSDPYAVPPAQAIVFEGVATLKDGRTDASKQGFCWQVGKGRMFYFQAGHETNPVFMDGNVRRIVANAVRWAAPSR
jgi:trehalose utilization protein